eukprot:scaffold121001_cov32-Tisochrysis_lutea.AAC.2
MGRCAAQGMSRTRPPYHLIEARQTESCAPRHLHRYALSTPCLRAGLCRHTASNATVRLPQRQLPSPVGRARVRPAGTLRGYQSGASLPEARRAGAPQRCAGVPQRCAGVREETE